MQGQLKFSEESLAEWREHPVTAVVLAILARGAASNKALLLDAMWESSVVDLERLGRAKAQAELIEDMMAATAEDWNEWSEHFER